MRNSTTCFRKSMQGVLFKAAALPKVPETWLSPVGRIKSRLLRYKKNHWIFEYSSVTRIFSRKQLISSQFSHLKKFTPLISAFMSLHPFSLSYTFTNKSFTFSGKKATIGCLSKHDNCICMFLYEGCLLNSTICLFLVHNLHQVAWSVVMVKEKYGLEVGNSCQISNDLHNIYITWVRLNSLLNKSPSQPIKAKHKKLTLKLVKIACQKKIQVNHIHKLKPFTKYKQWLSN